MQPEMRLSWYQCSVMRMALEAMRDDCQFRLDVVPLAEREDGDRELPNILVAIDAILVWLPPAPVWMSSEDLDIGGPC